MKKAVVITLLLAAFVFSACTGGSGTEKPLTESTELSGHFVYKSVS